MVNERTASRVKAIMAQVLDLDLPPQQIDDELPLYSSSIRLDSLGFLHLVVALEAEFGRQLEDEDVMQANLETVGNLIQLVEDKLVTEPVLEENSLGRSLNQN